MSAKQKSINYQLHLDCALALQIRTAYLLDAGQLGSYVGPAKCITIKYLWTPLDGSSGPRRAIIKLYRRLDFISMTSKHENRTPSRTMSMN